MTLAQRAVRASAWRWVSGMLVHDGDRTYRYNHVGEVPSSAAVPELRTRPASHMRGRARPAPPLAAQPADRRRLAQRRGR